MKKLFLLLFLTTSLVVQAQVSIYGKVLDENGNPLAGTAVYLNNTTIGTTTDSHGAFLISAEHGYYTLVASYLGYETSMYNLNTLDLPDKIVFKMLQKDNRLEEIILKNNEKYASKRAYFLRQFRRNFLGQSFVAKKARIMNEDVIKFDYDASNDILEAYAIEPLIVENNALGYKITYDLVHFQLEYMGVTFLGYSRYELMKGKKRKEKKWNKERELAYHGSLRHFLHSVMKKDTLSGFVVDEVRLIPNPDRPTEEEIKWAQEFIKQQGGLQRNPQNTVASPSKVQLERAYDIAERAKLKLYVDVTLRPNLKFEDYVETIDEELYVRSYNELRVTYTKEYAESNYNIPAYMSDKGQVSKLTFYDQKALINSMGLFHSPLDVLLDGYWAFEKVADLLPLDYKPADPDAKPVNAVTNN